MLMIKNVIYIFFLSVKIFINLIYKNNLKKKAVKLLKKML